MKIRFPKQFVVGLVVGMVLSITTTAIAATQILSAQYNKVTVTANGQAITLDRPLISVVDESDPSNAWNYMPLRAVLEKLGYTVSWDDVTKNIELTKAETSDNSPEVQTAKVTVDGKASDYIKEMHILEVSGENTVGGIYILADDLLRVFATKDTPYSGHFDENSKTYAITTKPPFVDGKPLRDVLDATGSKYKVQMDNGIVTVEMTLGSSSATLTIDTSGKDPGKVVCGDKSAEFQFYVASGATFIIEDSFVKALKDIGFTK